MNLQGNRLTWLGHATFRIETEDGTVVYIDPWLSNPLCPEDEKQVKKCDVMLCTHGHGDHIGDAVKIAKQHNPMVVGIFELCAWMKKKGAKQISPMNKGGTQTVAGIRSSRHSLRTRHHHPRRNAHPRGFAVDRSLAGRQVSRRGCSRGQLDGAVESDRLEPRDFGGRDDSDRSGRRARSDPSRSVELRRLTLQRSDRIPLGF